MDDDRKIVAEAGEVKVMSASHWQVNESVSSVFRLSCRGLEFGRKTERERLRPKSKSYEEVSWPSFKWNPVEYPVAKRIVSNWRI